MFYGIGMERLLTTAIAPFLMSYWETGGSNFIGDILHALLVIAILVGNILFGLMTW